MIRTHHSKQTDYTRRHRAKQLIISAIVVSYLIGCGDSIFKGEERIKTPEETEERTPVITIRKLSSEKINNPPTSGEKITWHLQADTAPHDDTLIIISIPTSNNQSIDQWVMIPKYRPNSERFTDTIYEGAIEIIPLPTIIIVGEGEIIDNTKLRQNMPDKTRTGVNVPNNFEFPMYTVGNPSQILCDDCNPPPLPTPEPPPTNEPPPKPTTQPVPKPTEKPVQPIQITQPTDITPPKLVSSTIKNGSVNINYAIINQTGKLEFEFNEPITGLGKITDVFGTNLQWRTSTRINTLTLNKRAGGNLVAGLTYTIELNIQDAFHNSSLITIVFVTRIKE